MEHSEGWGWSLTLDRSLTVAARNEPSHGAATVGERVSIVYLISNAALRLPPQL